MPYGPDRQVGNSFLLHFSRRYGIIKDEIILKKGGAAMRKRAMALLAVLAVLSLLSACVADPTAASSVAPAGTAPGKLSASQTTKPEGLTDNRFVTPSYPVFTAPDTPPPDYTIPPQPDPDVGEPERS